MKNLYFYPSASKTGYSNPYSIHYKKALEQYFNVLERDDTPSKVLSWNFFIKAFVASVFIVNWLESVPFLRLGNIQFLLVLGGLKIIQWRKKKIVWMFHNIHPHQGDNKYSRKIQEILFKQSDLIISHSKEATEYARQKAGEKVIYRCHPISTISVEPYKKEVEACDVLIWGAILPYKGIYEFISHSDIQKSKIRVRIIGRCSDKELNDKIVSKCNEHISFENRRIDFDELAACITKSRFVLFPYIGDCVSSSGALIDTISLGGTPIGPNVGAFKDLKEECVCLTYGNYNEILNIIKEGTVIREDKRKSFIERNSWKSFIYFIHNKVEKM